MANKKDLIPKPDSLFDLFMTTLYQILNTNAIKWKIDSEDLAGAIPFLTSWKAFWAVCQVKQNLTAINTANKNLAKSELASYTRPLIQKNVYLNKNMTPSDILSCGLTPHSTNKKHQVKPDTLPATSFTHGNGNAIKGKYRQTTGEVGTSKRGKPDGVGSLQTAIFTGPVPPITPEGYAKSVVATKSPYTIDFDPTLSGQKAWFISRWISTNHIPGDWSSPISITIN